MLQMQPKLLENLFASAEFEEKGLLTLRFYKHGGWRPVLIDTMVPCGLEGRPSFCVEASTGEGSSCWPSLVLKAYAKLHGGYDALDGGEETEARTQPATTHRMMAPRRHPVQLCAGAARAPVL
eukprot:4819253-Prymnesium_polylepis.2